MKEQHMMYGIREGARRNHGLAYVFSCRHNQPTLWTATKILLRAELRGMRHAAVIRKNAYSFALRSTAYLLVHETILPHLTVTLIILPQILVAVFRYYCELCNARISLSMSILLNGVREMSALDTAVAIM